ncbi:MAG: rhodanese-like domain-containing protein [Flavobacteriales bacterium]|nr:rhodanese-like domain-containing protein [Flavobacteriales bacterium]
MNKKNILVLSILAISLTILIFQSFSAKQTIEPWNEKQLISTSTLAEAIKNNEKVYIYNIGPAGLIKNAIEIGDGKEKSNIEKLKTEISGLDKNSPIVVYCGCCPFKDCPNIRPAFELLNSMNFTNHKLLNIPKNLKVDWIDKGYPMN